MLETLVRQLHLVRLSAVATAVFAFGCTGLIDDGGTGLTPEQAEARRAWVQEAQPVLAQNCAACHNGSRMNIGFMEGADVFAQRDDLLAYEPVVVNLTAPQSSRLLTKGLHEGPALTAAQVSSVLQWIQKQKDAQVSTDPTNSPNLQTATFLPLICTMGAPGTADCPFNDVALDEVGAIGSKIRFTVQALGSGLYVSNMKLIPGPEGAYIEHPLFVSKPMDGDAKPDTIDRFFSVKMNIQAGATDAEQQIAGGTAAFVGFLASDPLSIYFKKADKFQMDGSMPMPQSGCKKLTEFKAIRANFSAPVGGAGQACTGCHAGTNAGATGAMGIQNIGSADDAVVQNVCNQVLIRVNLTTPDSSGIYLAPDPGSTHPFRFTAAQLATFKTNVDPWITAEKTAP